MSPRKEVATRSSSLLLDVAAAMIASDHAYHAPTMDRDEVARVISDAARLKVLAGDHLAERFGIFAVGLQAAWTRCREDAYRDSGRLGPLSLGLLAMIAVDAIVSKEWLAEAEKSRHFRGRVEKHSQSDLSPKRSRLCRALKDDGVVQALLATKLLTEEEISSLPTDLDVKETRSLFQRYLRHSDAPPPAASSASSRASKKRSSRQESLETNLSPSQVVSSELSLTPIAASAVEQPIERDGSTIASREPAAPRFKPDDSSDAEFDALVAKFDALNGRG